MSFQDILDELATLPKEVWPEPEEEETNGDDFTVTIVMYEPEDEKK